MTDPFEHEVARCFQRQFPALFRYLDRALGDPELASDIAQESFVRLFERGAMPDEPASWLITVARNLVRDGARKAGRRLRLLEQAGRDEELGADEAGPAAALEQQEARERVRAALAQLPPRDRDILLLRHSGYSYREISVALELAEASVGTILLRAGVQFRSTYAALNGEPD
ncbi:MAG: sigma-70 family RNA polymerase sigma factor [Gemmatimonadota bacterium]